MTYLITLLVTGLLFFGFLLLTLVEARRGVRLFAGARYRLDQKVGKAQYLMEHIDWGAFLAHLTRTSLTTLAHDIAHGSLVAVRTMERFLTRAVRFLRTRRDNPTLPAAPRPGRSVPLLFRRPKVFRPMNDIVRKDTGETGEQ